MEATTTHDVPASAEPPRDLLKQQQAVVALGRRAVAAPAPALLLQDAAALIADMVAADCFMVAEVDAGGEELALTISAKQPDGSIAETGSLRVAFNGQDSLAGYVLQVGHPLTVDGLVDDSRFRDRLLVKHDIRSALAIPLCLPQRSFGALIVGSRHARFFDAADEVFAETVSHVVTTAIARCRAEQALAAEQRLSAGMLHAVEAIVLVLDGRGNILHVNEAFQRITGRSLDAVRRRPVWDVVPVAEELELFKTIFEGLCQGLGPVRFEGNLLTESSEKRRIAWSLNTVRDAVGEIESILATGTDVSELPKQPGEGFAPAALLQDRSDDGGPAPQKKPAPAGAPGSVHEERRRQQRRSYPYRQSIAPVLHGELPDPADFYPVQCNDIAAGGFSYWSPRPPESATIVVALGTPPALTYLHAQIAHVTRVRKNGKWMYSVGCSYTGRAFY